MLRKYQKDLKEAIYTGWNSGIKNIMAVLPCGGGKTAVLTEIAKEFNGYGLIVAHRQELLTQISLQLARNGVMHDLISGGSSGQLRKKIIRLHLTKIGRNFISDRSQWLVGGVDTLINMTEDIRLKRLKLIITDEAHHQIESNKWGKVATYAHDAKLLGFTATPRRADGKPLTMFDKLVEGVTMRELIDGGYLCDYKLLCPHPEDLDLKDVKISSSAGDYNINDVKRAVHASKKIVGNIVQHYHKYSKDKLAVAFAVDIDSACEISAAFNANGVPAEILSGKTPFDIRTDILRRFEKREILVLVSVEILGEGFDLPAVDTVLMARPTASFSLFYQQFSRCMRISICNELMRVWDDFTDEERKEHIRDSSKPHALILDFVGNIITHGFPDTDQRWTLSGRWKDKQAVRSNSILRNCLNVTCMRVYEKALVKCPYCGTEPPLPKGRKLPEEVDGDLELLDEETLNQLRAEANKVDGQPYPPRNLEPHVRAMIIRRHIERQEAQKGLRETIALWAGCYSDQDDRTNHKRFFLTFNITVLEAKALNAKLADELKTRITEWLTNHLFKQKSESKPLEKV